jgi:hypothetical protein
MGMAYKMIKGILHADGRPVIGLGVTYWGSYHPLKIPVPNERDRIGEMKKDMEGIRNSGFNIVRTIARGEVKQQGGTIITDFPFTDRMIRKAEELGLACLVRLQGYAMNLGGYDDGIMLNQHDEKMPLYASFLMNCVNHPGVIADNERGTLASARHFAGATPVVGFQIYNEPAYPQHVGVYCYHPYSIQRYREWLVENGIQSPEEAARAEPPRKRPEKGEDAGEWVRWRIFSMERLNGFLCDIGKKAKEGYPEAAVFTCHIVRPFLPYNACRGEDYFQTAEGMDFLGITHYLEAKGATYFTSSMALDGAESSAAIFGKTLWLLEYSAHTTLPPAEWERAAYNALGSAVKGIVYYQWRADYPYKDGPEANAYGLLYNDRTPTAKFDGALRMNALINRLSTLFANAKKVRSGIGILYSNSGFAYYDARDNPSDLDTKPDFSHFTMASPIPPEWSDRYAFFMQKIYTAFKKQRIAADFVRACDLKSNPLDIAVLIIPSMKGLNEEEMAGIEEFMEAGGVAYVYEDWSGWYRPCGRSFSDHRETMVDAFGLLKRHGISAHVTLQGDPEYLDVKLLQGSLDGSRYFIVSLIHYDPDEKPIPAGEVGLTVDLPVDVERQAVFLTPDRTEKLIPEKKDDRIRLNLPAITTGALIVMGGVALDADTRP